MIKSKLKQDTLTAIAILKNGLSIQIYIPNGMVEFTPRTPANEVIDYLEGNTILDIKIIS